MKEMIGKHYSWYHCLIFNTHHASECEQCCLDLRHVAVLKQVIGFEDIMRLQAIHCDGFDEVRQVLQLKTTPSSNKINNNVCAGFKVTEVCLFLFAYHLNLLKRSSPVAVKKTVCTIQPVSNEGVRLLCFILLKKSFMYSSEQWL